MTTVRTPVANPHRQSAKAKACHCNPNPHHPCVHTAVSVARKKAAAAKAKATNAAIRAKAEKILRAHPPTHAQIVMAATVAKNIAAYRKKMRKPATKTQQVARRVAAWKAAQTRLKHARTTPAHTARKAGPKPLPASFLLAAQKSVRAQMKAAALAHKKHRKNARSKVNPHTKALKQARQKKC